MSCLLCFGVECDELLIDIASAENQRLNVASTLHTHFGFCFAEEPNEGYVCQKCWIKVSVFHEFYTHIEYVHRSNDSVFVESIADESKLAVESNNDYLVSETAVDDASVADKSKIAPKRKRGRPRKKRNRIRSNENKVVESIANDIELNADSESDRWDLESLPEIAPIVEELQDTTKRKRGRPRKKRNQLKSNESKSVESCGDDIKPKVDSESDRWDLESLPEIAPNHDEIHNTPQESIIEDTKPTIDWESDEYHSTSLAAATSQSQNAHPKRRRGRPRKNQLYNQLYKMVESIDEDTKPNAGSESDIWDLESQNETALIGVETENGPEQKIERRRKDDSTKVNESDSESDDRVHSDSKFEDLLVRCERTEPDAELVNTENQQQPDIVKAPVKKRRWKKTVISKNYKSDDDTDDESLDDPTWDDYKSEEEKKMKKRKKLPTVSGTFQCETCKVHFLTCNSLSRHLKKTHNVKPFKCKEPKCIESFDTEQQLEDHRTSKHIHVECPHCKKIFFEQRLAQHIQLFHTNTNGVVCELCGKVSLNNLMHSKHLKLDHNSRGSLQCDICGHWYKNRMTLGSHMYLRHKHGPQTCDICGFEAPSVRSMLYHKRKHRVVPRERHVCDICGRSYSSKSYLKEHYQIHTGTIGTHQCNDCGKIFRLSSSFSVHKKTMHPKTVPTLDA